MEKTASSIRASAFVLGALFLLLALFGFVPGLVADPGPAPYEGYGYVLGIFPTNYLHNALGIAIGILGIAAATSLSGAITFNQLFTVIYAAQAILGFLPSTNLNTFFGTMPLFGNNVWLSIAAIAASYYYGFVKPKELMGTTSQVNQS